VPSAIRTIEIESYRTRRQTWKKGRYKERGFHPGQKKKEASMDSLSLYEVSCLAAGTAGNLFAFALFLSPV
jgi:hypothetical protein